jgi:uncharacterized protein (TIGR00266 family)
MEVQTRQGPAYGVARVTLAPNEPVRVESGAMMAMSSGVVLQSKVQGGMMKSLKRAALGGESFFVSTYTAPESGGFVDLAARLPGDLTTHEVSPGHALFVQKGSWLANDVDVTIDTQWGGFKNLFGGEGGFIIRTEGQGLVVFACYGALEVWNLQPEQSITIDTGHMVAYEDTVKMQMRKASGGGLVQSLKSGEGFVFDFSGPGRVWTQTRSPSELMGWIRSFVGTGNSSGTSMGGALGGIFGRD